jgi:hypothetical protein
LLRQASQQRGQLVGRVVERDDDADPPGGVTAADAAFENRILNCTSNRPVTIGECVRAILRVLDWSPEMV